VAREGSLIPINALSLVSRQRRRYDCIERESIRGTQTLAQLKVDDHPVRDVGRQWSIHMEVAPDEAAAAGKLRG